MKRLVLGVIIFLGVFSIVQAGNVIVPSLFQKNNVKAMALVSQLGLMANVRLVPAMSNLSAGHGLVDMQWPPSTTSVPVGTPVTLYIRNTGKGKESVPSPFKDAKLVWELHSNRIKSDHMITSSGAGGTTSKTSFHGFHLKGKLTGCGATKLIVVRLHGKNYNKWSHVTSVPVKNGAFEVKGTARGSLELRFVDDNNNLVYYTRSSR